MTPVLFKYLRSIFICSGLDGLTEVTDVLKETVNEANDAETIAHDALASINTRADEIKQNMDNARTLQADYEEAKFSIEATRKALSDLEMGRRARRGDQESGDRLSKRQASVSVSFLCTGCTISFVEFKLKLRVFAV